MQINCNLVFLGKIDSFQWREKENRSLFWFNDIIWAACSSPFTSLYLSLFSHLWSFSPPFCALLFISFPYFFIFFVFFHFCSLNRWCFILLRNNGNFAAFLNSLFSVLRKRCSPDLYDWNATNGKQRVCEWVREFVLWRKTKRRNFEINVKRTEKIEASFWNFWMLRFAQWSNNAKCEST